MDDERSVVVLGAVVGAALGGLAGYLFLTDRGAAVRRDLVLRMNAAPSAVRARSWPTRFRLHVMLPSVGGIPHGRSRRHETGQWVERACAATSVVARFHGGGLRATAGR